MSRSHWIPSLWPVAGADKDLAGDAGITMTTGETLLLVAILPGPERGRTDEHPSGLMDRYDADLLNVSVDQAGLLTAHRAGFGENHRYKDGNQGNIRCTPGRYCDQCRR